MLNLFSQPSDPEYDPFDKTPDAPSSKSLGEKGFVRKPRSAEEAILGANPELDREAYQNELAKQQKKAGKPKDCIKRIIELATKAGYFAIKCELYEAQYSGAILKRDLFGIIDVIGIRLNTRGMGTDVIGYQDTTASQVNAHLRKMVSTELVAVGGLGQRTYKSMTEAWLNAGCKLVIVGWKQEGRFWMPDLLDVTRELLLEVESRKRRQ